MEISAPYIHHLRIKMYPERGELRLTKVSSLVKADVEFYPIDGEGISEEMLMFAQQLLGKLQNVKELKLGVYCIEVLAAMAWNNYQLPLFRQHHLTIYASKEGHCICSIFCILQSSAILERLIIRGIAAPIQACPCCNPANFKEGDFQLPYLKYILITNLVDPDSDGKPMLTLVRTVLEKASVLRKMVIDLGEFTSNSSPSGAPSGYIKIAQTLLSYPRASRRAVVLLQ